MTFAPNNSSAPFLPTSTVLPNELPELIVRLTHYLNDIAYRINIREISSYEETELLTGQTWFQQTDGRSRQAYRKVILVPIVAAPGITTVAHGIDSIFAFTHMYGTLNLGTVPIYAPIPQAAPDDVAITADGVNIYIEASTATYNGAVGIVVLEYLKN